MDIDKKKKIANAVQMIRRVVTKSAKKTVQNDRLTKGALLKFIVWTNIFHDLDKYIQYFWKNTFYILDKYVMMMKLSN